MPYYVWRTGAGNLFDDDVTKVEIIRQLTTVGLRGDGADVEFDFTYNDDLPEVLYPNPDLALLMGWTDKSSAGRLETALRDQFPEADIEMIKRSGLPDTPLYGAWISGEDQHRTPFHVVACAHLDEPPSGPWQELPYETRHESLRIADLFRTRWDDE